MEDEVLTGEQGVESASEAESQATVEESFDREALEESVRGRLAAVFGGDDDDDDDVEDGDEADDAEGEAQDDAGDGAEEGEADSAGAGAEEGGVAIPAAHRASLIAAGWTEEEIDEQIAGLGEKFLPVAAKIHAARAADLEALVAAGRAAGDARQPVENQGAAAPAAQTPAMPQPLAPVDAAALKEKYGDDDLIDAIVGPVNATVAAINAILPSLNEGRQAAQQAEFEQTARQVDSFFASPEVKPYAEFYGDAAKGLSKEQVDHRNKLLDTAYSLMVGAANLRGQTIPLGEALALAHEMVGRDAKQAAVRQEIKATATRRQRSMTMKPTRAGSPLDRKGPPRGRSELESRTRARLRAVFG